MRLTGPPAQLYTCNRRRQYQARVLNEQQLFDLGVRRPLQMGLPMLCADIGQAARLLGFATAHTLAQGSHFVAFAGLDICRLELPAGQNYLLVF